MEIQSAIYYINSPKGLLGTPY